VSDPVRLRPRRGDWPRGTGQVRADLLAGLTVGIVALPLALAFGVSSGMGAAAGLVTAIVAGAVAAAFGGSRFQVSGPTGAMTVVLIPVVARHGAEAVLLVGVLAGLFLVVLAGLRVGRFVGFIPTPVVEGFTLGIALIIALQQVPAALGVDKPEAERTLALVWQAAEAFLRAPAAPSLVLTGVVVALMVVLPRLLRAVPASLVAVALATLAAEVLRLDVPRIGALPSGFAVPALGDLPWAQLDTLVGPAIAIAALAAIESLLSATVADGMSGGERHDPDRELFGQGLANAASCLVGGMPATGAIARTAVNIRAGAQTRLSALAHAGVVAGVVLGLGGVVALIPLAALAGVLLVTAARMVEFGSLRAIVRTTRSDALVLVATAAATLLFDLVVAVEVGIAVAGVLALRHIARSTLMERLEAAPLAEDPEGLLQRRVAVYRFDGSLFFGAAHRFLLELTSVSDVDAVVLRLSGVRTMDATGAALLGDVIERLEHRGVAVLLSGARPQHESLLRRAGVLERLAHERHLFAHADDAVRHAIVHAERKRAA
ncbi:MAG TPA: SulP family inorganic anion transporter, partial [Egibacteraceae bacterium]|nr:SulP family inorganic anion transporter [Egibacteraceae bacterium]